MKNKNKKNFAPEQIGIDMFEGFKQHLVVILSIVTLIVYIQSLTATYASATDLDKMAETHNDDFVSLKVLIVKNEVTRKKDTLLNQINEYTDLITVTESKPNLTAHDQKTISYYTRKREDLKTQLIQFH